MTQYSFDVGLGVFGIAPSPNQVIKSKYDWWSELIKNSAKYNRMSEAEVIEYTGDVYEQTNHNP